MLWYNTVMHTILDYLIANANTYPNKIAIRDENTFYTYKELLHTARSIGAFLKRYESCSPAPIGVIARHDTATLLAFLGIVYSGHFYVPIDPKAPTEKIVKIIADSGMKLLLGRQDDFELLPEHFEGLFAKIEEISKTPADGLSAPDLAADAPLYMIYTSGSTGYPKGVLKTHKAVISFLEAYTDTFDFSTDEILGSQTPFFFDASAKDIYLTLKLGATMEIIPEGMFTLPPALIRFLNEKKITFISWVPSALCVVTQLNTFEEVIPETVKKIFFVGESFPIKQFRKWQETLPDVEYVNLYGATELAGICCFYRVPSDTEGFDRLPIGKPLKNCDILLVESQTAEHAPAANEEPQIITAPHKTGEIWLASDALFEGYYNDPEKTAASISFLDGKRFFKTGDLAWYDEDGNLNFAARNDSQIKHMGQRIELGEIEAVCNTLPCIRKACCLYHAERKRIYLFCELNDDAEEDQKSILIQLKKKLVSYMMPQRVVIKDHLPLNANGKTDRQLLKTEMKY